MEKQYLKGFSQFVNENLGHEEDNSMIHKTFGKNIEVTALMYKGEDEQSSYLIDAAKATEEALRKWRGKDGQTIESGKVTMSNEQENSFDLTLSDGTQLLYELDPFYYSPWKMKVEKDGQTLFSYEHESDDPETIETLDADLTAYKESEDSGENTNYENTFIIPLNWMMDQI